jgi:hypothetical protein
LYQTITGSTKYAHKINGFSKSSKLGKEGKWVSSLTFNDLQTFDLLYIYLKGTYTNLDATKTYTIDDLYLFNRNSRITTVIMGSNREGIVKLIPDY